MVVTAIVARTLLPPVPASVATTLGIWLGGFVAGKWADFGGLYHGAVVGAGWIVLEALGVVPTPAYTANVVTDTVLVIAIDALTLLVAAAGGYLARPEPSSSSGTGRGR